MPLPSPEALRSTMERLGCKVSDRGWCFEHESSLLIHDGGRAGCSVAWEDLTNV